MKLAQNASGPESGFGHPGDTQSSLPGPKVLTGKWARVLSNHPFDITLERSEGIYLYDTEGNRYIDVSGGALATSIGAGDPRVLNAMREQAERFVYVTPAMANEPRADLCERISHLTPGTLNTTYLISGGSEAVETALKLARQYHIINGQPDRKKYISLKNAYHGVHFGAASVNGINAFRRSYEPLLNGAIHVDAPWL